MKLPTFEQLPFVFRVVIDPVRAFDLLDSNRSPDHAKVVPFFVLCGVFALKLLHAPLSVAELLIVVSASFGATTFRTFLKSKSVSDNRTLSEVKSESKVVVEQILARRDPVEGIDPTHE